MSKITKEQYDQIHNFSYAYEFDQEVDMLGFLGWMLDNLHSFVMNLGKQGWPKKQSIREWIHTFLCWSEYEDNK